MKTVGFLAAACAVLALSGCDGKFSPQAFLDAPDPVPAAAVAAGCPASVPVETGDHHRLALVVGVGEYANPEIPALPGATADAGRFVELLAGPGGYGFPSGNICQLVDAAATREAFLGAMRTFLIDRVKPDDVVVIYFSGHGSQMEDVDGDEPDGMDETLVLHDARSNGVQDLVDDDFNALLAELSAKTSNVSVILDSCNSGTATRGGNDTGAIARYVAPDPRATAPSAAPAKPDGGRWKSETLKNVTVLSAALDGTPAFEIDGRGVFTDAIVRVAGLAAERSLTFGQLERRLRPLVAASSDQIPYIDGPTDRVVFDNTDRPRPFGLTVDKVEGETISLSGPPLPGLGAGAELRIYSASADFDQMLDPAAAKALLRVESAGTSVKAVQLAGGPAAVIAEGDVAILARPGPQATKLRVRFVSSDDGRTPMQTLKQAVATVLSGTPEAATTVELADTRAEFAVFVSGDGTAIITGPSGESRWLQAPGPQQAAIVARSLVGLARQRSILALQGEPGGSLKDGETLQLTAEPVEGTAPCTGASWVLAAQGQDQIIPLCQSWRLRVTASAALKQPVQAIALALSSDGAIYVVGDPRGTRLAKPGESVLLDMGGFPMRGQPPLGLNDYFVAFAIPGNVQNDFSGLAWHPADVASTRSVLTGALVRSLDRYATGTTRDAALAAEKDSAWSISVLATRVEANPAYATTAGTTREYGVPNFDVRPYLPPDRTSPLYRVLEVANSITNISTGSDPSVAGYTYKQHDWKKGSDEANLKEGIDCSRAIWFVFTRAGVPYTAGDKYIATAEMRNASSPMKENFQACPAGPNQIGDILVYRDDTKGDGHVVMVVDPERRIAWGSHGWDGNPDPVRGAGYQKIKVKKDWALWDRSTMKLVACWRHKAISQQLSTPAGRPGLMAGDMGTCSAQCRAPPR